MIGAAAGFAVFWRAFWAQSHTHARSTGAQPPMHLTGSNTPHSTLRGPVLIDPGALGACSCSGTLEHILWEAAARLLRSHPRPPHELAVQLTRSTVGRLWRSARQPTPRTLSSLPVLTGHLHATSRLSCGTWYLAWIQCCAQSSVANTAVGRTRKSGLLWITRWPAHELAPLQRGS